MKKAKVMLVAVLVLAGVGGALAFKAQKFNKAFCTQLPANYAGTCPFSLENSTFTDPNQTQFYYIPTDRPDLCPIVHPNCDLSTYFTTNG